MTPNVRRILGYQRTFAHYLSDEEAQLSQSGGQSTTYNAPQERTGTTRTAAQKQANTSTKMGPPPPPTRPRTISSPLVKQEPTPNEEIQQRPESSTAAVNQLPITSYDNDPLLKSNVPKMPSDRVMTALLSEPPLSYNAARAGPSTLGQPSRSFCAICGYWGKIRCKKCGERTCGLMDCYQSHDKDCQAW